MVKFIKDNGAAIVTCFGVCITALAGILVAIFNKNVKLMNIQHDIDGVNEKLISHDAKLCEITDRMGTIETDVATMRNDIKWIMRTLESLSGQR